jgi:predicted nucleotidyltransferase
VTGRAHGEVGLQGALDPLVECDSERGIDVFGQVAIAQYLKARFSGRVDVCNRPALRPTIRPQVEADALYAF